MKRRISIALLLSVFCASSLLAGIFPSHVALAANKYPLSNIQWVNNNTVKATTSGIAGFPALYFFDTNDGVDPYGYGFGGGRTFKVQPGYPCAKSYIFVSYLTGINTTSGYHDTAHNVLSFATPPGTNGACQYINYLANKQPPPTGIPNPVDAGVQVQDSKLSLQDNDSSVTGARPAGSITPRPFYTSDILYTIADDGKPILRINRTNRDASWTFTQTAAGFNVFTQGSAACSPTIVANPGAGKFTMYELEASDTTDGSTPVTADSAAAKAMGRGVGCNIVNQGGRGQTSNVASGVGSGFDEPLGNSSILARSTVLQPINSTNQNSTSHPECEASGGTLTWLLCGVFNAFASITDWMLTNLVQPLLKSDPISTDPSDPTYQIWSNFRNYGDIFLVIALLVVVFAEVIGGGLIDTYTVRKVLPRILVAAILINLSVYIVALLVDITNIVGGGIGALITAPLKGAGEFQFSLGNSAAGGVVGLSAGSIAGFFAVAGGVSGLAGAALPLILLSAVMPALVGLLAAIVTIVLRKGLILFLVMISPVAFALYALPNTQQYFKKWWDLLLATLLVYPIIMVIFAVADVLSVTIMSANSTIDPSQPYLTQLSNGFSNNALAPIVSFVALFLPLIMIPYAFRLAGGAIGKIHETLTDRHKKVQEAIKGNPNDQNSMRNRYRNQLMSKISQGQQRNVDRGLRVERDANGNIISHANAFRRARGRFANTFGNVEGRMSRYNAEQNKLGNELSSTGRDAVRYAAAGYKLNAGQADWRGGVADHDRWFDAKGNEIVQQRHNKSKQLVGNTIGGIGSSLEYTYGHAQTPDNIAAARFAMAQNAIAGDWTPEEMKDVWAQATYPHKDKWLSEWHSTPVPTNGVSGRGGVQFQDASINDDSLDRMINEQHTSKESFRVGSLRPEDWLVQAQKMEGIQSKIDAGTATDAEITRYAKMSENLDSMARSGLITQNGEGEVQVSGGSSKVQGIIGAMYRNRRYAAAAAPMATAGGSSYSVSDRILYDVDAVKRATTGAGAVDRDTAIAAHAVPGIVARNVASDRTPIVRVS